ncbi:hypothetical protein AB0E83_08550 [Streptomyces sp. NPDC035033]|uniref:hypothetical protein n=1 Tax=Streptomyces sp. NPDC035033 TaxID=3155368 RepID=UPI00340A94CA
MRKPTRRSLTAAVIAGTLTVAGPAPAQAGQNGGKGAVVGSCAEDGGPSALLTIDYRNGRLNSGIPDLTTTHATAADASSFGSLKWGLYRPGRSLEKGDVPTRIVHHDDIRVPDLSQG